MSLKSFDNYIIKKYKKTDFKELFKIFLSFQSEANISFLEDLKSPQTRGREQRELLKNFLLESIKNNEVFLAKNSENNEIIMAYFFKYEEGEGAFNLAFKNTNYIFSHKITDSCRECIQNFKKKYNLEKLVGKSMPRKNQMKFVRYLEKYYGATTKQNKDNILLEF